jgi:oligopeptide/dipeptide ABC transporter ATP-binding protein
MPGADENVLVQIDGLVVNFYTYQGVVQAIEGVDLEIRKGETLGVVGETGCGKSVTASAIMRLILSPPGKIEEGSVYFLEPVAVRARRKQFEKDAQAWYSNLPLAEKQKMVAEFGVKRTGFSRRSKKPRKADIQRIKPPEKAPHKLVARYMTMQLKKVPKNDKIAIEALSKNYNLLGKNIRYMQKIRGKFISMIFQEPTSALNPVFPAGEQIAEVILQHRKGEMAQRAVKRMTTELELEKRHERPVKLPTTHLAMGGRDVDHPTEGPRSRLFECSVCHSEVAVDDTYCETCGVDFVRSPLYVLRPVVARTYLQILQAIFKNPDGKQSLISRVPILRRYKKELEKEALREAIKMLDIVRIPDPKGVAERFPFELSGGMQQRVMIAIALACNPRLLIADEPTTALDVTIQGQILKLMRDLKAKYGSSILLITHNLGVVAEMCDRVGVMYAGSMAEISSAKNIFKKPLHPYTTGLMKSVPSIQMGSETLFTIRGSVPNLIYPPSGCRFHPRCDHARKYCTDVRPPMLEIEPGHFVACHMASKAEGYENER